MEQGHNFESAYFTIPDGIDHGADLYCSYRACRAEGCKFRYCATCKAPAARRNFRKRHGHGEYKPRSKAVSSKKSTPAAADADANADADAGEKIMQEVFHDAGADPTPKTTPAPAPVCRGAGADTTPTTSPDPAPDPTPAPDRKSKVRPRSGEDDEEMDSDALNECWDALLKSRPDVKDGTDMDAWLLRMTALTARMNRHKCRKIDGGGDVGGTAPHSRLKIETVTDGDTRRHDDVLHM